MKLPLPVKGPMEAETVGAFFGSGASSWRAKNSNGVDQVCLRVDLYSKWLLKGTMQAVGIRKDNVFEVLLVDWPGRTVILSSRITVTETLYKLMNPVADGSGGSRRFW